MFKTKTLLTTLAVGMFAFQITVMAAPVAETPPESAIPPAGNERQVVTNEELQTRILNTLDNAEGIAAGMGMAEAFGSQIKSAREHVLSATPEDLEFIPPDMYGNLSLMEVGTGNIRLMYDPALRTSKDKQASRLEKAGEGMSLQSTGAGYDESALEEPGYPNAPASTQTFERGNEDPDDDTSGGTAEVSACTSDGTPYTGRAAAMNVGLVLDAIRNIMDKVCNQTVIANASLACIPFEIAADVVLIVDANLALCNEHNSAAEISATWHGLKTVHGNVQHVHDDLVAVDSDLATHDVNIDADLAAHDANIDTDLAAHDANIDTDLAAHDANIDTDLAAHDANIDTDLAALGANIDADLAAHDSDMKSQVTQHDADIKSLLSTLQATADENQRLIMVSMSRQLEILRLQITPQGSREINPTVLSCLGDDCPLVNEVFTCGDGTAWPCKVAPGKASKADTDQLKEYN